MTSTFHGLETARRSLFTQQTALNTTGHNISNASTPGYSRQRVDMSASRPIDAFGMSHSAAVGQLGTGVEADAISRVRERFLDDQYRNENKSYGNYTVQQDALEKLEGIVNEPSDTGIRTVISDFWNAWSDLTKNPEDADGRKVVKEKSLALTDTFNHTAKQLSDLSSDLTENINTNVAQINSYLQDISQLNVEIQRVEALGDNANDLRDHRDLLTDNLSGLVNINVEEQSTGYRITMGSTELVNGSTATPLDASTLTDAVAAGDLNNGSVYGMIYSRDHYVQGYIDELDKLANTIANGDIQITIPKGSVLPEGTTLDGVVYSGNNRELTDDLTVTVKGLNGLHELGYDLAGNSGQPFFTDSEGSTDNITAASMTLNPELASNPNGIATSMRVTTDGTGPSKVITGNNSMAVLFSQMRDARFEFGTPEVGDPNTIDAYFRSVIGQLGVQTDSVNRNVSNQKILVDQVDTNRQSVSGVSLDEEMSNMIMYQHAYNAAARNMTMIDEMLDKVINGMGRVGL